MLHLLMMAFLRLGSGYGSAIIMSPSVRAEKWIVPCAVMDKIDHSG
jgi:hypothetical protein